MKIAHWETALHDYVQSELGTPFSYGQTDCPLVCFGCFDAMTGGHESDRYRGQWKDRNGALRYVRRNDTDLLRALIALDGETVQPGFQQPGDFILSEDATGWIRGHVCLGMMSVSSTKEAGICLVNTAELMAAPGYKIHVLRIA